MAAVVVAFFPLGCFWREERVSGSLEEEESDAEDVDVEDESESELESDEESESSESVSESDDSSSSSSEESELESDSDADSTVTGAGGLADARRLVTEWEVCDTARPSSSFARLREGLAASEALRLGWVGEGFFLMLRIAAMRALVGRMQKGGQ